MSPEKTYIQDLLDQIQGMLSKGYAHEDILSTVYSVLQSKYSEPSGHVPDYLRDKEKKVNGTSEEQLKDSIDKNLHNEYVHILALERPKTPQAPITFTKRIH
jgi:hypothetical protein